jgi:hypothetical protein
VSFVIAGLRGGLAGFVWMRLLTVLVGRWSMIDMSIVIGTRGRCSGM